MRATDKLALLRSSDLETFGENAKFGRLPEAAKLGCPLPAPFSPPIQVAIAELYRVASDELPDPRHIWTPAAGLAFWPQPVRGFA